MPGKPDRPPSFLDELRSYYRLFRDTEARSKQIVFYSARAQYIIYYEGIIRELYPLLIELGEAIRLSVAPVHRFEGLRSFFEQVRLVREHLQLRCSLGVRRGALEHHPE